MDEQKTRSAGKCPVMHGTRPNATFAGRSNRDWWPNQLNLRILHQNSALSDPMDKDFDYAMEFKKLDLKALKKDLFALMTDSQEWWPADYGHYGPFFIRMAWHSAGTYRVGDGRGGASSGTQRFAPLNSWPDNVNLDKARRLIWPIKQKYGNKISWADLMILAGNCALESMGFKTFGFGGGRVDVWEPEEDIYWGNEDTWLGDKRYSGDRDLENPLAAVQMGLIYVNPEGPNGKPDPLAAARDIRETFARMAMNDEETVALIAGGHTFGKTHGAAPASHGADPIAGSGRPRGAGPRLEEQIRHGQRGDAITSGLEVIWTTTPTKWSSNFFWNLFGYEWELTKSPAGAHQWRPKHGAGAGTVPDAHDRVEASRAFHADHRPRLAVRPCLRKDFEALLRESGPVRGGVRPGVVQADAPRHGTARTLSRSGGARRRSSCGRIPSRRWITPLIDEQDIRRSEAKVLASGLSISDLVSTAWASASTFRGSDKRGGANGARIRLAPQKDWEVNQPAQLARVLRRHWRHPEAKFNASQTGGKKVSLADLIVLGGCAAVEQAAKNAGHEVKVPFAPGAWMPRRSRPMSDSFAVLEPAADGFRNYLRKAEIQRLGRGDCWWIGRNC